jgi:hypothetical protein
MTEYAKLVEDVSVLQSTLLEDEIQYDDTLPLSIIEFWRNVDPQVPFCIPRWLSGWSA